MAEPQFWRRAAPLSISDIAAFTGAKPRDGDDLTLMIANVAPLDDAGPGDLAFLDNPKYAPLLESCRASAVLVAARHAERVPGTVAALIAAEPYRAYAQVAAKLYPQAARPLPRYVDRGVSPAAHVHPSAQLENGVTVDPGAVIGARVQIGAGAVIAANAVIGPDVCIGRDSVIGSGAQIGFALIGDRVIIHPGVCIGQDGFGFAMGPRGHLKVPQLGRVIIQNDVEIGANSTIDRGANRDTVIGEGTKIDNFVQIGHNVVVGRHCILVSHVGIAGSAELGDFVAIGGQAGIAGHLKIGMGAQIAAQSGVASDVPPGERWGGSPARPMRHMARQIAMIDRMVNKGS